MVDETPRKIPIACDSGRTLGHEPKGTHALMPSLESLSGIKR